MATTKQLYQWCSDHGYHKLSISPKQGFHMDFLSYVKIAMAVTVLASVYYIGKEGLPDTWAGIKNVYAWIRGLFSAKTITTTTTTQPTTTPVA